MTIAEEIAAAQKELADAIPAVENLLCSMMGTKTCGLPREQIVSLAEMMSEFGAKNVIKWIGSALRKQDLKPEDFMRYVGGCAKKARGELPQSETRPQVAKPAASFVPAGRNGGDPSPNPALPNDDIPF